MLVRPSVPSAAQLQYVFLPSFLRRYLDFRRSEYEESERERDGAGGERNALFGAASKKKELRLRDLVGKIEVCDYTEIG